MKMQKAAMSNPETGTMTQSCLQIVGYKKRPAERAANFPNANTNQTHTRIWRNKITVIMHSICVPEYLIFSMGGDNVSATFS